ncbi:MAG: hypothetical protein OXH92_01350 [Bryobacterales bacterium]|nr:hypothetical protein [Bryobacterales bacterium]
MATNQTIDFKDPLWITAWLDTALEKEKEKYKKCPVMRDMVPGHEAAQGWGYVVTGYFLVEQSFKALLYLRKKKVPQKHSLSTLFDLFDQGDKAILREYYADYRASIGGYIGAFPFSSLDDFLLNLDGDKNNRGNYIGSFDWRYFLIEEKRSKKMPLVSVDYLHEIVYGCNRIVEYASNGNFEPSQYTRSRRLRWKRQRKYHDWLTVRMNSDGWDDLGDRLEILWGPDYRGRHDLYLFKGKGRKSFFSKIPDDFELPVVDKRKEIEAFDSEEGYRSIGVTRTSPPFTN